MKKIVIIALCAVLASCSSYSKLIIDEKVTPKFEVLKKTDSVLHAGLFFFHNPFSFADFSFNQVFFRLLLLVILVIELIKHM